MRQRTPPPPPAVVPTAIYSYSQACRLLRLCRQTAAREVAAGRLRVSRRAGRYYLLGQWLLDWIAGGVVTLTYEKVAKIPKGRKVQATEG